MTTRYKIERLLSMEQLPDLGDSWDVLTRSIPWCSVFLSWVWMSTWWSYLRNDEELWLLTARDQEDKLVGLAPLMRSRHKFGPITFRRLSLIGTGIANPLHLDFLAREEDREEIFVAFLQYLNSHDGDWDILDLQAFREDSLFRDRIFSAKGCWLERGGKKCFFVSLPSSWEVFENKYMNRKLRTNIRYSARRLEKDFPGKVTFQSVTAESDLDQSLDFLIENSRQTFNKVGVASSFANDDYCLFYREIVKRFFRQGFLRFYHLKVNDQIIAVQHCFSFHGIFYGHQMAYGHDWGKYSPGHQLLTHVLQQAILEKAQELNMSYGETGYKARWAREVRFDHQILYARNRLARIWLFGIRTYDRFLDLGRKVLPIEMRRKIGEILGIDLSRADLFGQQ